MSRLYLVGFMGVGKSSVAGALAARLEHRFIDLDGYLVERLGMSIREVFDQHGEEFFRAVERRAIEWTVSLGDAVIATGGGAFCSTANRRLIHSRGGRSVFLDLPWPALAERLAGDQSERPKFTSIEAARVLFEERRPSYLKATWTIDLVGDEPPEEVAQRILEVLAGATCAT